ncbi:MAG: acyl-CoA thioesterase [Planctomycetaceae bacterium]|nr:acyl-CoA thioesterase [Planctomycetaceae bacterium]
MNWLIEHFTSGQAFFSGTVCIIPAGALAARSRLQGRGSRVLAVVGLLLVAASATPLDYRFYGLAGVLSLAWLIFERRGDATARRTVVALRAGVLIVWLAGVGQELPYHFLPALERAEARRLIVFGDSVTAGLGRETTWPTILRREHELEVVDLSRIGATASMAASLAEHAPLDTGLVLIEIGGNDLFGDADPDKFAAGLDRLLKRVSGKGRDVVMFELPLPPLFGEFGRVQRRAAKKYGVKLIPKRVLMGVLSRREATSDSIHLTRNGQQAMARAVWRIVADGFD